MSLPAFTDSESSGNSRIQKTLEIHYNDQIPHELARIKKIYRRARESGTGVRLKRVGVSPNKTLIISGTRGTVNDLLTVPRSPYRSPPKSNRNTRKIPGGIATRRTHRRQRSLTSF